MNKQAASLLIIAFMLSIDPVSADMPGAAAATPEAPDAEAMRAAESLAITTCATCHGPRGNSISPKFPKLAGQQEAYLVHALTEFRKEGRGDPDARAYMWGMAAPLDDETIAALAKYFSMQKPSPGALKQPELASRGKEIFEHGVASENVIACVTCHGSDAQGNGNFPRLAGQYRDYLVKQLSAFRNQLRNVAIMHAETKPLTTDEIQALAAYLEGK